MGALIELGEHAAVRAWRSLAPDAPEPTGVHVLRQRGKSTVYRLEAAGPLGTHVVAKHCRTAAGLVECRVHAEILPRLPVTTARCHGHASEADGTRWLFLEYVDGARFTPALVADRVLAARWLALLHTSAATLDLAARLPDRGPAHHLAQLRQAGELLRAAHDDGAHAAEERALLAGVASQCERVDARWGEVEERCAAMPRTLVHGDFRPKNVYLRDGRRQLVALDWETAGWGVPAADVASIRGAPGETAALGEYESAARGRWPRLTMESLGRMVTIGKLFRRIAAISWCSVSLHGRWERSILAMRVHVTELDALLAEARW